ncbi:uncharacterized protein LOC114324635 isoform X1 [Diabrotica virgifera virgifera]|uniref:Uncharacterized protein LOC114324635 n=1 Tax=Diabrotica virgifera virgifera TaxID=50390 RepID=A0A6P7F4B3_DIAVI|nr:uncharacterized protein LOC114324635 isoform X1 [Diabrotica virgifera virgifera]
MDVYMLITIFVLGIDNTASLELDVQQETGNCNCSWKIRNIHHKKGNEYFVVSSKEKPESGKHIQEIKYESHSNGEIFEITKGHYTEKEFVVIIDNLVDNEEYTLSVNYRNDDGCPNCTTSLKFKTPERLRRNIPVFVGIVASVSLIIIAMCFYNIRSKCIYRYIQEIKRLPLLRSCGVTAPEVNVCSSSRRCTINSIYLSIEHQKLGSVNTV